jgi:ABC-type transporter Mla MlaB component
VFRTELPQSELPRSELPRSELPRSELPRSELAVCGSRVISPHGPQPPQLGDEPPLYDDGALRITQMPGPGPGYALAGEIDEAALPVLARRLGEIAADLGVVHLNLAHLDYTDLAGLRVIVGLADGGHRGVVLHQVPPHLRAILNIVGWDAAPGVQIAG